MGSFPEQWLVIEPSFWSDFCKLSVESCSSEIHHRAFILIHDPGIDSKCLHFCLWLFLIDHKT